MKYSVHVSPFLISWNNPCFLSFLGIVIAFLCAPAHIAAQSLKVTYGSKGVQTISYLGVSLEDLNAYPSDGFHIWHLKSTSLSGNVISSGQYGWGESNNGENWNLSTKTETYTFTWGTISTQFVQKGDNLDIVVTETNNAGSGIIFDGAELYPFALHFPRDPTGFNGYSQYAITTTGPGVSAADFGSAIVTAVIPDESVAMYTGWKVAGQNTYTPILTSTAPDGLATFLPRNDRPVPPGSSFTYTISLRFTPAGVPALSADAYSSFAAIYPSQMTWTDKRIIGTSYLASSPAGSDIGQPGGFPTNPRRYFNDPSVDVTTASGMQQFQARVLQQAASNVTNTQALGGQGVITWDIEGEQYPQTTSYVCSPEQIASVAPEMESTVTNRSSAYYGQKLDDAYFKTMTSAGLKVGVCLRPQVFSQSQDGRAKQTYLTSNAAIVANLENKAKFANTRWGVTIFYIDSTVDITGGTLDPAIFQQLITDMPSFLFIPEESTPRYYAYSAPFYSFIFHQDTGTAASIYNSYPKAFGANLVNDVSAATLAAYQSPLTKSVANGDILMGHADYWQANNPTLRSIYQAAGANALPPIKVTPVVSWGTPASITFGTPLSPLQLNATASTLGEFVYSPANGTVLNAGTSSLLATFRPSDSQAYNAATASVSLMVAKATPSLAWGVPPTVFYGTPLGQSQLNAVASVPGTITYAPSLGIVLPAGTTALQASFLPSDTTNYASVTLTVPLTVSRASPSIAWTVPSAIVRGTPLSNVQLNANSNVPGTFRYSPDFGSILDTGTSVLQVLFSPSDSANYLSATASVNLIVAPAKPTTPDISWTLPSPITYGTQLSVTQLNAQSSVAGAFTYSPALGTVLAAGTSTLHATFVPADISKYTTVNTSVNLVVSQADSAVVWNPPAPLAAGTALNASQLNATASNPGSFSYTPPAGTVLPAGSQNLTATFYPFDASNYATKTISVPVSVILPPSNSRLYISAPLAGSVLSGSVIIYGQCDLPLDSAGTLLIVDGIGIGTRRVTERPFLYPLDTTTLANGTHILQLWGHDIGNNTTLSSPITITVAN